MPQDQYQRTFPFSRIPIMHPALLYDDCDGTWNWKRTIFGGGPVYEYDPSAAHVGLNGILLQTGADEPAANQLISIYRDLWLPPNEQVRLQAVFNLRSYSPDLYLAAILHWFTGTRHELGALQFRSSDGACEYASIIAAGSITWTPLAGYTCQILDDCWNKLDLSLDIRHLAYHRININEQIVPTGDLVWPGEDDDTEKHLEINFVLQTLDDAQATAYIDQVLVTPENP